MYIHEQPDWPQFRWQAERLADQLADVRFRQGRLLGRMEALGFALQDDASFRILTEDVIKTSEIEGERLDVNQVRSSLARRLGIDIGTLTPSDHGVDGIVEITLDATKRNQDPLTDVRLQGWQAALFPTGRSGMSRISAGAWRTGPMHVVSGDFGRERVHFEAPDGDRIPHEMEQFLTWFNDAEPLDLVLKSALAHLWFVTIHPFDDGNGRIARAIADLTLARSERMTQRFYSMSAQIQRERDSYYQLLEATQKSELDVTYWLDWFLGCLSRAIDASQTTLASVMDRARFWNRFGTLSLNDRQRKMLNLLFEGFTNPLTASRWAKITSTSQDTALRDIAELVALGVLSKDASGGRSTSYSLVKP